MLQLGKFNRCLTGLIILLTTTCKKDAPAIVFPAPLSSSVNLSFSNTINGDSLKLGELKYQNAAGNMYQVDVLKYYISNVKLIKADSTEILFDIYKLVNEKVAASKNITLKNIPNGRYTKLQFYVGIDPLRNHSGLQDGDLDPKLDMIWDWNTGYIFFKHEGKYKNSTGAVKSLYQHLATDSFLTTIEVPLNIEIANSTKSIYIDFNLNSVYTSPFNIDFNTDGVHLSESSSEAIWMHNVKSNLFDAFTFKKFE